MACMNKIELLYVRRLYYSIARHILTASDDTAHAVHISRDWTSYDVQQPVLTSIVIYMSARYYRSTASAPLTASPPPI